MVWNIQPPRITRLISKNRLLDNEIKEWTLDKRVTVISVFGPSEFFSSTQSGGIGLKKSFQLALDAFGSLKLMHESDVSDVHSDKNFTTINGIYNEEEAVILLCLDGAFDPNVCLDAFQALRATGVWFMRLWSELKCSYSKSLFLLFSISHLMILSNVGAYFDTSYIGLFQALERLRHDMQPYLKEVLRTIPGLPDAWINQCRICSPRVLFFMPVASVGKSNHEHTDVEDSLRKLKTKLGSDVYQILRKCRIITNHSGNSLFAIPMDEEADFVFLYDEAVDHGSDLVQYINKFCENSKERTITGHSSSKIPAEEPTYRDYVRKFKSFLLSHIKVAQKGGFDDNAHRPGTEERKSTFILPKVEDWMNVFTKLMELLNTNNDQHSEGGIANDVLSKFAQYDTDAEYLEKQCNYNFHKIFSVYSKNLPAHYSYEEQTRRVNNAIDAFLKISTAPGVVPWLEKLTEKCERFWKRGRQQCPTRSLHRKLCINPCHQIEPGDHLEVLAPVIQNESLPKMKHSTGSRLTSYCNCGRRSGIRDSPFTIRAANYDFYERLTLECCHKLESFKFPVFEDSQNNGDGEGFTLEEMLRIFLQKKDPSNLPEDEEERPISLERDLRQEEEDDEDVGEIEFHEECDDFAVKDDERTKDVNEFSALADEITGTGMGLSQDQLLSSLPIAQPILRVGTHSRLSVDEGEGCREFLPGMLHSRCPDLLPLFPSWALVRFGPANVYAHNVGILYQPDFLVGSAFLLPYDVRVKAPGVSKPVPRRIMGKQPGKGIKRFEDVFNVKIFIGFEYECRKGHRFMLESPDKVLNITNPNFGPSVREAATKVATSDMPLYFKCPCNTHSTGEQLFGQLMRIHVVTPKAPVFVQLTPRVQPAVHSPYFLPGKEPLKLNPSGYWILRMPFSYVSEDQIFSPPTSEDQDSLKGRITRGLFDVVSMTPAETVDWELKSNQ